MKAINAHISELIQEFAEAGVPTDLINQGECMNFAEALFERIKGQYDSIEILSDAMFIDPFDSESEDVLNANDFGIAPADLKQIGMPCHYWVCVNGVHYDSEVPNGVNDIFLLPTLSKYYNSLKPELA